jgi:hypothetical protein
VEDVMKKYAKYLNLTALLILFSLVISCAAEQKRSQRWTPKTTFESVVESCQESSFGNIDVCGNCAYSGNCSVELPGGCAVDIAHIRKDANGTEHMVKEYLAVDSKSKALDDYTNPQDKIRIYMLEDSFAIIECEILN